VPGLTEDAARRAAEAFARALVSPGVANDLAADIATGGDVSDPKALRVAVRRATFARLAPPAPRGLVRRAAGGMRCPAAREAMLERAEGRESAPGRLSRHVAVCGGCRATAASLTAGERAFSRVVEQALAGDQRPEAERWRHAAAAEGTEGTPPPPAVAEWPAPVADEPQRDTAGTGAHGHESWRRAVPQTAAEPRGAWGRPEAWVPTPTALADGLQAAARRRRRRARPGRRVALAGALATLLAGGVYLGFDASTQRTADETGRPAASATSLPTPLHGLQPAAGDG
jgi:hypothetical protein